MIKFNDNWQFEHDGIQWHLHQWKENTNPTPKNKRIKTTTYHPDLHQVAQYIMDREIGKCETLIELQSLLSASITNLMLHLQAMVDDEVCALNDEPCPSCKLGGN